MTWIPLPWKNPVIVKDIRTRMRGSRAFILLSIHLAILSFAVALAYYVVKSSMSAIGMPDERRFLGKAIFGLIVWIELVMVSFIAPALTSGSISTERERQTYDLLRVTLLPARSLVLGKYTAGLVFVFLLLFTSIPMQSPAFLIGGVLPSEIVISILILVVTAMLLCAAGLFFSTLVSRTLISTILSYAFTTFIVFGIPILASTVVFLFSRNISGDFTKINPLTLTIVAFISWFVISTNPVATMIATEVALIDQHNPFLARVVLTDKVTLTFLSPWIPYVVIYLILSLVLLWISISRVKTIEH